MVIAYAQDTNESAAVQHARDVSMALSVFRSVYSSEVVGRLADNETVTVTHDYHNQPGAIPLPATLSIELAEILSDQDNGAEFRLLSDYPFPWRQGRALTPLDQEILSFLSENPQDEFQRRVTSDAGDVLAFASPVVMTETCVACHNSHPDSPRTDWRVGDVRGAQAIAVPLPPISIAGNPGLQRIIAFLVLGFATALSLVGFLVHRNQIEIAESNRARALAEDNETRIRAVFDNTVDVIVTFDAQGIIHSINPAVERLFGFPAQGLIRKGISVLLPEIEASERDDFITHYLKTGESQIIGVGREVSGRRIDGSTFAAELSVSGLLIGGQRMFTGILRDISQRKSAEAKAREAEATLIEAVEALPEGFVLYDEHDRLVVSNTRYRELYKTSADLIRPGVQFEDVLREGAQRGQYQLDGKTVDDWVAERMVVHRNPGESVEQKLDSGQWLRIIEQRTERGHTVGFRVDITEIKEREEALRRSQDRLAATVNAALDAIIVINHEGSIIEFNPAAETIFGLARNDVLGREMAGLIVPEHYRQAHREGMDKFLITGEGPVIGQRIEIEGLRADGQEILLELAIQEAVGNDGPVFIGYARNITEEKAAQKALIEAKDRAEVASVAKATFLAMMSHEIRTPLNGVLGILNLLQDTDLDLEQVDLVKTARDSGKSLLAIINDILDFSKLEAAQMTLDRETFRPLDVMRGVVDLVAPLADQKNLRLSMTIGDSVPDACIGDAGRLRQVLLNLASNAVKFTDQGWVKLSIASPWREDNKARLEFEVSDTGIGLSDKDKELIFSEFTMVDPSLGGELGGTGLGLAISKAIVEAMDGTIDYRSTEGAGSTFHFEVTLPIADPLPTNVVDDNGHRSRLSRRIRVLVAEDNPTNQMVASGMLEAMGCVVDIAADGREAVSAIRTRHYDAVLMDIAMPVMDGMEATAQIRQLEDARSEIPIFAVTAYALDEDRNRFIAAGMNDVISKPVVRRELFDTLEKLTACQAKPAVSIKSPSQFDTCDLQPDLFDRTVLISLIGSQSMDLRKRLVDQFLFDVSEQHAALQKALEGRDLNALEAASHVLKSLGQTFGARSIAESAEQTNKLARRSDASAISEAASLIEACSDVLQQGSALAQFVADQSNEQ